MKKLLGILVLGLFLITPSQADDIRDFEIEGMSIGDSLLDYFTISEIKNFVNYDDLPSDMKFRIAEIYSGKELQMNIYDFMQIYYKPEDKKFILHGLNGGFDCPNINDCDKKYEDIIIDISEIFKKSKNVTEKTIKHPDDKSGKSTVTYWQYKLEKGDVAIHNTDWSSEVDYADNISLEIVTNEVRKWVNSNFGMDTL
jgi:hypothetical protein